MGDMAASTDVLVLGGGPGGYAAAFRAASHGFETTIVSDEEQLGGVCLLRGCIPSKALLEMTGRIGAAQSAAEAGIDFGEPDVDVDALREWTEGIVERLTQGLAKLAEARDVRVVQGRGRFESPGRVRVEGGDVAVVEYRHAIIATGSRPVPLPDVPFDGPVIDSAGALNLDSVPGRLLVVGGGYVGLEMGTVYARLGSKVVVVEAEDRLLPQVDADLTEPVAAAAESLFEEVRTGTTIDSVSAEDDGVTVEAGGENGDERFDRVLVAVGREPATGDLGLDAIDVDLDDDGFISVDEARRTSAEGVFAIGDVTPGLGLAHEAMREGKVAADVIAGKPAAYDVRAVPAVVYTHPQVAYCGLDERTAEREGIDIEVARFPLRASGRALAMGGDAARGFVKLVADAEGRIRGAGVVGPHAETLISEATLAVEMGATARDVALTVHPHPTLSEAFAEAAELLLGQATHTRGD